jgi:uncharacterized protein
MNLDPHLREIIVCPQCHGPLLDAERTDGSEELTCVTCALAFPVTDDIPVLLLDEARPTD